MKNTILDTEAWILAPLMNADKPGEADWNANELVAVLEHQLNVAIEIEATWLDEAGRQNLATISNSCTPPVRTFGEALFHAAPPIELLIIIKQFAKSVADQDPALLPRDIAYFLYCASNAAALARHGKRITSMDARMFRTQLEELLNVTWLTMTARSLLNEALLTVSTDAKAFRVVPIRLEESK